MGGYNAPMKKKAVVTGGGGFIGSNLAAALVEAGWEVHLVDIDFGFRDATLPAAAIRHQLDLRDTAKLQEVCDGADVVFHTAALPARAVLHRVPGRDDRGQRRRHRVCAYRCCARESASRCVFGV